MRRFLSVLGFAPVFAVAAVLSGSAEAQSFGARPAAPEGRRTACLEDAGPSGHELLARLDEAVEADIAAANRLTSASIMGRSYCKKGVLGRYKTPGECLAASHRLAESLVALAKTRRPVREAAERLLVERRIELLDATGKAVVRSRFEAFISSYHRETIDIGTIRFNSEGEARAMLEALAQAYADSIRISACLEREYGPDFVKDIPKP